MVPVTHQVNTNRGYLEIVDTIVCTTKATLDTDHGTKAVITPKTNIVTDAPHIAVFRPNLSDTNPEQNDPRAKPVKSNNLARVLSQEFSQTRSHSVIIVASQNS